MKQSRPTWLLGAAALGWALIGAVACSAMIPLEPNLLEEGLIVHAAQRLLRGERLYRDIASFTGFPQDAVFQTDVGLRRMTGIPAIYTYPPRTRLAVSVGRGGVFEQVASVRVLERAYESWDWTPLDVDISAYGGERVTLRLESRPDTPLEPGALVGWRSPRVVLAR